MDPPSANDDDMSTAPPLQPESDVDDSSLEPVATSPTLTPSRSPLWPPLPHLSGLLDEMEKAAEGTVLGQVIGAPVPDDVATVAVPDDPDVVATVAEEAALGHVVGGGVPNVEDKEGEIVLSPVVVEPVADSPTAPTISAKEVATAQTSPSPMPSCSPPSPPSPTPSVGTVSTSAASLLGGSTPDVLDKVAEGTALGQIVGGPPLTRWQRARHWARLPEWAPLTWRTI